MSGHNARYRKLEQLRAWLENESAAVLGVGGTHDLHLWDWEVRELLEELQISLECPQRMSLETPLDKPSADLTA